MALKKRRKRQGQARSGGTGLLFRLEQKKHNSGNETEGRGFGRKIDERMEGINDGTKDRYVGGFRRKIIWLK